MARRHLTHVHAYQVAADLMYWHSPLLCVSCCWYMLINMTHVGNICAEALPCAVLLQVMDPHPVEEYFA